MSGEFDLDYGPWLLTTPLSLSLESSHVPAPCQNELNELKTVNVYKPQIVKSLQHTYLNEISKYDGPSQKIFRAGL